MAAYKYNISSMVSLYVSTGGLVPAYTCDINSIVPQTIRFGVLSWKKGTCWAGSVARGSELGARGAGSELGARGSQANRSWGPGLWRSVLGTGILCRGPALSVRSPCRASAVSVSEPGALCVGAPGPDTETNYILTDLLLFPAGAI